MGSKVCSVYKQTGDKFELDAEAIIRCCGGLPKTSEEFMQAALKWWHELDDEDGPSFRDDGFSLDGSDEISFNDGENVRWVMEHD